MRLLLVDDDPAELEILQYAANTLNADVELVCMQGGVGLVESLERLDMHELPNLILMDINMPIKNGLECLKELQTHKDLCRIPVVMYSTSDLDTGIRDAFELGAARYVRKPYGIANSRELILKLTTFDAKYITRPVDIHDFVL